ncbi:MAG: hypothetical protein AVDCRST_MAG90-1159 [uncultured Microvirga sp.]|uniref:DUF1778 domain-containing protein n=1 Tax=uncultured Microvirga sp. TaxID=412392 RepID=A0A6J4LB94_9HYPH|nr:MAG: hypothetical protein AVDCRST_MAG90-1159 [uncultured Microvirga sp.]
MLAFRTDDLTVGGKSARMEQRTTQQVKELIEYAACLLGVNSSEFTVVAATRAARETVREYEMTTLKPEDHEAFLRALDETEPSAEMLDLMKMHAEVTSG